jgi:hypothetical protein
VFVVLAGVVGYEAFLHDFLFKGSDGVNKLPFLPLMIYSVVCAVLAVIVWMALAYALWLPSSSTKVKQQ